MSYQHEAKRGFGMGTEPEELGSSVRLPSKLRVALLVISSAFLSGIAVVLWNRRSLERIRQRVRETEPAPNEPSNQELEEFI